MTAKAPTEERAKMPKGAHRLDNQCWSRQDNWDVVKVNGYWIWWCDAHSQPWAWCLKNRYKDRLLAIKELTEESDLAD